MTVTQRTWDWIFGIIIMVLLIGCFLSISLNERTKRKDDKAQYQRGYDAGRQSVIEMYQQTAGLTAKIVSPADPEADKAAATIFTTITNMGIGSTDKSGAADLLIDVRVAKRFGDGSAGTLLAVVTDKNGNKVVNCAVSPSNLSTYVNGPVEHISGYAEDQVKAWLPGYTWQKGNQRFIDIQKKTLHIK